MDIKNIINNYYSKINEKELNSIKSFFEDPLNLNEENIKIIQQIILNKIAHEKNSLKSDEKHNSIKKLISFVSLAPLPQYDFSPIEKTKILFPSIDEFYLLNTIGSRVNAENIKNILETKYNSNVNLVEINIEDYSEIYSKIETYIFYPKYDHDKALQEYIDTDQYLIDATLGQKMVFDAFNRFSIEKGIKILTWQNEMEELNKKQIRLPGTENLYFNKTPEKANYISYRTADILFSQYKFNEASYIYEAINNEEMKKLCKILGEVFTFDNLFEFDTFKETIQNSGILEYKIKIKKIVSPLEDLQDFLRDLNEESYKIIKLHFITNHYNDIFLIYYILEDTLDSMGFLEATKMSKKFYPNMKISEILILLREDNFSFCDYPLENNKFSLNVSGEITFENKLLSIPHLKINNEKLKNLSKESRYTASIQALFESSNKELTIDDFIEYKQKEYTFFDIIKNNLEKESSNPSKYINEFEKKIISINQEVEEKFKIKDFFIFYKPNKNLIDNSDQKTKEKIYKLLLNKKYLLPNS